MLEYLTPMFFLHTLFTFGMGIWVLIARCPLLLSERWSAVYVAVVLSPLPIISLMDFFEYQDALMLLGLPPFLLPIYFVMRGKAFAAVGITDESFQLAIHAALQQLNITYELIVGYIKLTSHDLELQVTIHSSRGSAVLKMKQSNGKPILDEIAKAVVAYYQAHETKANNASVTAYFISGLSTLIVGIIFLFL